MRIHLTIVLIICQLIAFSLATEYAFFTKCPCKGTLSDLKLNASVDHENNVMTTFFTGIATNFSKQSLRAYPAMYKDETGCNKLDADTLRKEAETSDSDRESNPGTEKIHKHYCTWSDLTPADHMDEIKTDYEKLFTGCYFFEYKPADNTCKTCYTNTVFINTSMDYVKLAIEQKLHRKSGGYQLDVDVPLPEMQNFVEIYTNVTEIGGRLQDPKVECTVSRAMKMDQVCTGSSNISIVIKDKGTNLWTFRMKWNKDQNFNLIRYDWNVTSPPKVGDLGLFWEIPTASRYLIDNITSSEPSDPIAQEQSDMVWIIIVGVVGVVIILCICLYVVRDRMKQKKKKKKMNPEVKAAPAEIARVPPASDILFLYSPGDDAFQKLLDDVKNKIRIHCPCRVYDYRAVHEYSEDWSIGPKELIDEWFNHSSNRIIWFDTPQLRAYLRPGSNEPTGDDYRKSCLRDALGYARTNHLDPTVLATRHFVCRIKGIPEYVVTTESDADNPLSWITRGVHCHLPDHMADLLEMLSVKDITKNEFSAENEIAGQDSNNEEDRKIIGSKNDRELGNHLDKNGRTGYFSKDGYEIVSTSDNGVNETDRLDSRTSSGIELRQPLRDPRLISSPAQKDPANTEKTWTNGYGRNCADAASRYLPNGISRIKVGYLCP